MNVVFHLGAHRTDNSSLLRCLAQGKSLLEEYGVHLPAQETCIPILLEAADRAPAHPNGLRRKIVQAMDAAEAERVVFSSEEFLGFPLRTLMQGQFYPAATERVQALAALFPDERIEFHLGIRSPATFLPALIQECDPEAIRLLLEDVDLTRLRWSELIERMRSATPDAAITIWCDEDMPFIWPEAVSAVAGHANAMGINGLIDRLAPLLTEEGARRLAVHLTKMPGADTAMRSSIVTSHLAQFGRRDAMELQLDMPGWTMATIDRFSDVYEEDIDRIAAMDGVTFLSP